jgi:hypothetical protein
MLRWTVSLKAPLSRYMRIMKEDFLNLSPPVVCSREFPLTADSARPNHTLWVVQFSQREVKNLKGQNVLHLHCWKIQPYACFLSVYLVCPMVRLFFTKPSQPTTLVDARTCPLVVRYHGHFFVFCLPFLKRNEIQ